MMRGEREERAKIMEVIGRRFEIKSFDIRAAWEFGILWENRSSYKESTLTRNSIKFDFQIMAIAKVNGASCIYSHDKDLMTIAKAYAGINNGKKYMEIKNLPSYQPELKLK